MAVRASDALDIMRSWLGMSRNAQTHRPIIDLYNSYRPLARGYAVKYWDDYCDTAVSAVFIKLGAVDLIGGTECGVHEHVQIFKRKGIWKGRVKPAAGWLITYDWDGDGIADHIGFVEDASSSNIICIEANINGGIVARRTIWWNDACVYGYAAPAYEEKEEIEEDGWWGPSTTKLAQKILGTTPDGTISNQPKSMKQYLSACQTSSWKFVSKSKLAGGSALIRAIQKKIGAKVTGYFDTETVKKFQHWLGVEEDGWCGNDTVRAFQKWLNKNA